MKIEKRTTPMLPNDEQQKSVKTKFGRIDRSIDGWMDGGCSRFSDSDYSSDERMFSCYWALNARS